MMPLSLVAWLQKIWTVTLKSAKTKAKNEEIFKKKKKISCTDQNRFALFLEKKEYSKFTSNLIFFNVLC